MRSCVSNFTEGWEEAKGITEYEGNSIKLNTKYNFSWLKGKAPKRLNPP